MQSGKVVNLLVVTTMLAALLIPTMTATADSVAQTLPFSQDWSNAGLITTSDSWSGVPGIMGYRGDGLASSGDDPQTVLSFSSGAPVIDVNANQANPNTNNTGGVTEFAIADPVVALQGSGTAAAPFILINLNTLGWVSPQISYNIRDIDGSTDNAIQQVALQYRIGDTGDFTNLPDGYIADATEGPSLATKVTPIKVLLPAITSNQPLVQIRIITVDAAGSDEWVGIDDIQISDTPPTVVSTAPASGEESVNITTDIVVNFSEPVILGSDAFSISCSISGSHNFTLTGTNPSSVFTLNPDGELNASEICTVTVIADKVTDNDNQDPPKMAADFSFSFGTAAVPPVVVSTVPGAAAINVLPTSNLTVTFSEDVTTADGWFTLECPTWGSIPATSTGTGNTRTIDPTGYLPSATSCTVTVLANQVTDLDGTADAMAADYSWAFTTAVNVAPAVSSLVPGSNATNVSLVPTITVNFNEEVTTADGWFTLQCPASTPVNTTWTGTGATRVITPTSPLPAGTVCSATIENSFVTDLDLNDPKQPTSDTTWSFTTTADCYNSATAKPIHDVQGTGDTGPLTGSVTVEGIVTADFQAEGYLGGYFLQAPDTDHDADPLTSEGIFVYNYSHAVNLGDYVRVTATIQEYMGAGNFGHMNHQTQLVSITRTLICATNMSVTPVTLSLPLPDAAGPDYLERYESMLVTIPDTLTLQQNFFQGRFGQLTLGSGGRIINHLNEDSATTFVGNLRRMIILDDGSTVQNRAPIPYYTADGALRAGDTLTGGLTGVLDQGEINSATTPSPSFPDVYYRLHPTVAPVFNTVARPAAPPEVGGRLKVASYNVLNYFTTLGSRGANTAAELARQHQKLVNAICTLDADVIGLIEIENNGATAVNTLLDGYSTYDGLNDVADCGPYAVIADPPLGYGSDVIKVTLIYRTDTIETVGSSISTNADPFDSYRYPVAQTFREITTGSMFSVVVNHFKSKNCDPVPADGSGDENMGVEGGCYNATRVAMANTLLDWIDTVLVPVDPDVLVIGDLNAYGGEDPIATLTTGGLIDQVAAHLAPAERYSYVFDGTVGYLDHGLSTANMDAQITGIGYWHINADEPSVIDYNTEYKDATEPYSASPDLYQPNPYRSSDHDPVVIGLNLYQRFFFPIISR